MAASRYTVVNLGSNKPTINSFALISKAAEASVDVVPIPTWA